MLLGARGAWPTRREDVMVQSYEMAALDRAGADGRADVSAPGAPNSHMTKIMAAIA